MGNDVAVKDAIKTNVFNLEDTFTDNRFCHGFDIPDYQRQYDWKEENVKRLFESIFNGIDRMKEKGDFSELTFLGTIILADKLNKNLSIVDGQQRLTTLLLIFCGIQKLIAETSLRLKDILDIDINKDVKWKWLFQVVESTSDRLLECVGWFPTRQARKHFDENPDTYLPKIIRDGDSRSTNNHEYSSVIADYLYKYGRHFLQTGKKEEIFQHTPKGDNANVFTQSITLIDKILDTVKTKGRLPENKDEGFTFELPNVEDLLKERKYKYFFHTEIDYENSGDYEKDVQEIVEKDEAQELIRLIFFGIYMLERVVLTSVITNEKYVFDIFESLNTTGEPLTAIQTLRPLIIKHFNGLSRKIKHQKHPLEKENFLVVEKYISGLDPKEQKNESVELVILFSNYAYGKPLPKLSISFQRNFIRSEYQKSIDDLDSSERYVQALTQLVEYKELFWNEKSVDSNLNGISSEKQDLLDFCLKFIKATNTTLTIPILARYYFQEQDEKNKIFFEAVKAISAFLALRRSVTGTTAGIDGNFRHLMSGSKNTDKLKNIPLCIFNENGEIRKDIPSIDDLKGHLKYLLSTDLSITNKEEWRKKSLNMGLYKNSQPLCKFLLLVANNNGQANRDEPGLIKDEFKHRDKNFLHIDIWDSKEFESVEHIAPSKPKHISDWDKKIYVDGDNLINSIGNLALIPKKDNASISNRPWSEKQIYYKALSAKDEDELNEVSKELDEMNNPGKMKKIIERLKEKKQSLPTIASIASIPEGTMWDKKIIENRGENILSRVWDTIAPWMGYDET